MEKVLLLNASYEPLNICSWRRALVLIMKGKAEEIENNGYLINKYFHIPTVIRLRNYVAVPYKELPFNRKNVLHRDNHTCQYCGKKAVDLSIDHIIPRSKGGKSAWENVITACVKCNTKKADSTPNEAGMKLLKKPIRPASFIHFELTKYSANLSTRWKKYLAS